MAIMRTMHWSYEDLENCPDDLIQALYILLSAEADYAKSQE